MAVFIFFVLLVNSFTASAHAEIFQDSQWPFIRDFVFQGNPPSAANELDCTTVGGITCDGNGMITQVNLYGSSLSVPIPESIGQLVLLKNLDLSFSQISGPLPDSLGNLTFLETAYLNECPNLNGTLPSSLGKLVSLREFDIQAVKIIGSIPESFGDLKNLKFLDVSYNSLTGPIPLSLAKLNISAFSLYNNFFTGPRPTFSYVVDYWIEPNCWSDLYPSDWNNGCTTFCGTTSLNGVCNGHGICNIDTSNNNAPTCQCDEGYKTATRVGQSTCLPALSTGFIPANVSFKNMNKFSRHVSFGYRSSLGKWSILSSMDWIQSSPPVQDQGDCSSCWSFAAVAAFDSLTYLFVNRRDGAVPYFSVQQVMDCTPFSSACNCEGGWPQAAMEYIASRRGSLCTNASYPYIGEDDLCNLPLVTKGSSAPFYRVSFEQIDFFGWFGVLLALQQQPLIVFVTGSYPGFQAYEPSVTPFNDPACFSSGLVDHVVVLVGYRLDAFTPFWTIRNSWGPNWGQGGYMQMAVTGGDGVCGVHSLPALYPVISGSNPCSNVINPCGAGKCSYDSKRKTNSCKCPSPFINVTNSDGTQSCVTQSPCSSFLYNPCGFGSCVDDFRGSFSCVCPQGYATASRTDGTQTCVYTGKFSLIKFTPQAKVSCSAVYLTFLLSPSDFQKQNPKIDCSHPIAIGTPVVVKPPSNQSPTRCGLWYSWTRDDTCTAVLNRFRITEISFLQWNPGLPGCAPRYIQSGQQVCVSTKASFRARPFCTKFVDVPSSSPSSSPYAICAAIQKKYGLSPASFQALNPGIFCSNLNSASVASNNLPTVSQFRVCVSAAAGLPPRCKTGQRAFFVRRDDSCPSILYFNFGGSATRMARNNGGFLCRQRALYVGLTLCAPVTHLY